MDNTYIVTPAGRYFSLSGFLSMQSCWPTFQLWARMQENLPHEWEQPAVLFTPLLCHGHKQVAASKQLALHSNLLPLVECIQQLVTGFAAHLCCTLSQRGRQWKLYSVCEAWRSDLHICTVCQSVLHPVVTSGLFAAGIGETQPQRWVLFCPSLFCRQDCCAAMP